MFNNKEFSNLSDLGEFGLIDHLTSHIKLTHEQTLKGVGDDAAVINCKTSENIVITTDMLAEGVHFDLMYTPLKHLGYKAVTVNLSDVVAMNAIPAQITVSLGLSSKFTLEAVSSKSGLILSITALGYQKPEKIVYRKGAQPNDLLCVTGDLGGAYLGLQLLEREKRVFLENPNMQPDLDGYDYIVGRQLKPEARIDIIKTFDELNIQPTAMIDISDGLSSEILHLCKQSDIGIRIYEEKLPFDPTALELAEEFNLNITTCALNGGEDYELLFTINPKDYEKIKGNLDISIIGHCTESNSGAKMITPAGQEFDLVAQGWKAF